MTYATPVSYPMHTEPLAT